MVDDDRLRPAGFLDQRHAALHLGGAGLDEALDFARRTGAALRQFPHLLRHDRKTAPGLARTGRLDAGVQRQQVGLESDLVDDADDGGDLFRGLVDLAHGMDGAGDDLAGALGMPLGVVDGLRSASGAVGGGAHDIAEMAQRPRALLQRRRLLFGAAGEIVGGSGEIACAAANFLGGGAHVGQCVAQRADGIVVGMGHLDEIGRQFVAHAFLQIAGGEFLQHVGEGGERLLLFRLNAGTLGRAAGGLLRARLAGGGGLLLQPDVFQRIVPEDGDRTHHVADLVATVAAVDGDVEIALRQTRHGLVDPLQRPAQALDEHQAARDGEQRAEHHRHDRYLGGTLTVFLAEFLRIADEALEIGHGGVEDIDGGAARRLPVGGSQQHFGGRMVDQLHDRRHLSGEIAHRAVLGAELGNDGTGDGQFRQVRHHHFARFRAELHAHLVDVEAELGDGLK